MPAGVQILDISIKPKSWIFQLNQSMRKSLIILCVAAVVTPFGVKAAAGYFAKMKVGSSVTPLVAEKSVLIRDFFLNPVPDFSQGQIDLETVMDLSDANIVTTFDEVVANERRQWQGILTENQEYQKDSVRKTVSADFVQRNFCDEQASYYSSV